MSDGPDFDPSNLPEPDFAPDMESETPAFRVPNHRPHGRNRSKLWGNRDKEAAAKAPRQRTVKPKPVIPNRKGQFVEPLTKIYVTVGTLVSMNDPVCGRAIVVSAPNAARALDDLAQTDEFVRNILWSITQTSKYGAVIGAHLPILFAIAMHHVPAVQRAVQVMGEQFAESVINGEGLFNANGAGPESGRDSS